MIVKKNNYNEKDSLESKLNHRIKIANYIHSFHIHNNPHDTNQLFGITNKKQKDLNKQKKKAAWLPSCHVKQRGTCNATDW